jgi:uncharacterized RDD family membrane protein YckC
MFSWQKIFMQNQIYSVTPSENTDLFTETPVVYASFMERFGATFIDGLILLIPNLLLNYLLKYNSYIVTIPLAWLYSALMESGPQQATLGKRAVGLIVTDTNGQRISFGQATGRHFGKTISFIILFVGYLMMLWDDRKQTLHDKMANTLVVKL